MAKLEKYEIEPNTGCWLWYGKVHPGGYGVAWREGSEILAHRLSWEIANGVIPDGMCVLHKCDTPACVNPSHLFLGNQADNMADMDSKGRRVTPSRTGSKNAASKITEVDVAELRSLRAGGASLRFLSEKFGLSKSATRKVYSGRTWAHV